MAVLHIRYQGESLDAELSEVDLGDMSSDADVRTAAARVANAPLAKFSGFVVDRNAETGDITVRPQAVFG